MPKLLVFNPGHEEALACPYPQNYTPSKTVRKMMSDLASLMRILAEENDYIYYPNREGNDAEIRYAKDDSVIHPEDYPRLPHLELSLWAWEPHLGWAIVAWARENRLSLDFPLVGKAYHTMSHRSSATTLLRSLSEVIPELVPRDIIPIWCGIKSDDIHFTTQVIHKQGYNSLMLKRPFTSSGRGVMELRLPLSNEDLTLIEKYIRQHESVSIERKLRKQKDYALLLHIGQDRANVVGYSKFVTETSRGVSYAGNILMSEEAIREELVQAIGGTELWQKLEGFLREYLWENLGGAYQGYVGIDMMTYLDKEGKLCLHPCIEINVRCTMGVLASRLQKQLGIERGYYRVGYVPKPLEEVEGRQFLSPKREHPHFIAYIDECPL